ncbi:hypothetical protein DY000_02016578 [Brassica cretica]|uniref:Uncharacterized protein n=1 Tax=Brassica cretica TaxID=69181 RepID=A0ABQ7CRQ4_BRACR|nr:hypothetical protein DY000_02016578 [Brassica cretica]
MRMSKCEDCEEIISLLIGMRNYYLLADFWTRTSPKYTNLVRTRHTVHWNLARNPRSQRAGGLTVRVKNGYDEVNFQIPEEEKRSERTRAKDRLLRSDRALARSLGPRSLRSDRALPKHRYNISPCVLVYPSMLSPEDRSEPISRFPAILSYRSNFTVKTTERSFFIERNRNKCFESEDSPKGPKT